MLLFSSAFESVAAHPDYIAYFNLLAGKRPENIVVDSDLDWGQDLSRLAVELKRRKISGVYLAYFGTADPNRHGVPILGHLRPDQRVNGFVAISLTTLKIDKGFAWLNQYPTIARVGKSILLVYVDPHPPSVESAIPP